MTNTPDAAAGILSILTLDELAKVEKAAQLNLGAFGKPENMSARLMAAFAWVYTQRSDPTYSLAQAMKLTLTEVNAIIANGAAADPTPPLETSGLADSSDSSDSHRT